MKLDSMVMVSPYFHRYFCEAGGKCEHNADRGLISPFNVSAKHQLQVGYNASRVVCNEHKHKLGAAK